MCRDWPGVVIKPEAKPPVFTTGNVIIRLTGIFVLILCVELWTK